MSAITDGFLPASFRGVPFQWFDVEGQHGQRGQEHEFPQRDTPYFEPLGRGARQFVINACTIGANYAANRDALIAACEAGTAGLLIHPTQKQQTVFVPKGGCLYRESTRKLGVAYFTITFVEAGSRVDAISVSANTQAATANAAEAAMISAQAGFVSGFQIAGAAPFVATAAQAQVIGLFGLMQGLATGAAILPIAAFAFVTAAAEAAAGGAQLVASPAVLGAAIVAQVRATALLPGLAIGAARSAIVGTLGPSDPTNAVALAVTEATDDPSAQVVFPAPADAIADAVALCLALSAIDPNLTLSVGAPAPALAYSAPQGLTPGQQSIANNEAALLAVARQSALAMASKLFAQAEFVSYNDAIAVRDDLATRLDAEILAAGEARVRKALRALRVAAIRDLSARAVQLPKLISFTPTTTLPARIIAHRIYDDPAYAADIVARNDIEAPGFVPAGVPLEVISDAA